MTDRVTFWYGCNVVRHGDIIRGSIALLKAVGIDAVPAGGAGYCCGTTKDANLRAAEGMATRTVEKFNAHGTGAVVTWCPSCHRHMHAFMDQYTVPQFTVSHITQLLHRHRDRLAAKLMRPVRRRVMLHTHFGFREVDVNPLVRDLLALVPGLTLVDAPFSAPGHMCSALARVPQSLQDVTRQTCEAAVAADADTVVTVFHSCQRLLCGLEATEPFAVMNWAPILAESLGVELRDEYKEWKKAGSEAELVAAIGPRRIDAVGERLFREALLPELLRRPQK